MTPEEILQAMRNGTMNQQSSTNIPVEKLDEFIDRCVKERDETLMTLGRELQQQLQDKWLSTYQHEVYALVLQRIQQRLNQGEV